MVFNFCHREGAVPFHVERDFGAYRKRSRDGRVGPDHGKPQPLRQGIGKVMVVEDVHAKHLKAGSLAVKVNVDGIMPHRDHPEYVVTVHVHVVVVDLLIDAGRSNRTGVQIESNEGECAPMLLAIRAYEPALAEAHVGLEGQPCRGSRGGVCSSPAAAYVR